VFEFATRESEVATFGQLGYKGCVNLLAASDFGDPQSRKRYYIVFFHDPANTLPLGSTRSFVKLVLDGMKRHSFCGDVADYFLPDNDLAVRAWSESHRRTQQTTLTTLTLATAASSTGSAATTSTSPSCLTQKRTLPGKSEKLTGKDRWKQANFTESARNSER
jgi:site-specific DNA-cytosine methylase